MEELTSHLAEARTRGSEAAAAQQAATAALAAERGRCQELQVAVLGLQQELADLRAKLVDAHGGLFAASVAEEGMSIAAVAVHRLSICCQSTLAYGKPGLCPSWLAAGAQQQLSSSRQQVAALQQQVAHLQQQAEALEALAQRSKEGAEVWRDPCAVGCPVLHLRCWVEAIR